MLPIADARPAHPTSSRLRHAGQCLPGCYVDGRFEVPGAPRRGLFQVPQDRLGLCERRQACYLWQTEWSEVEKYYRGAREG